MKRSEMVMAMTNMIIIQGTLDPDNLAEYLLELCEDAGMLPPRIADITYLVAGKDKLFYDYALKWEDE